jgi:hypothetical protein
VRQRLDRELPGRVGLGAVDGGVGEEDQFDRGEPGRLPGDPVDHEAREGVGREGSAGREGDDLSRLVLVPPQVEHPREELDPIDGVRLPPFAGADGDAAPLPRDPRHQGVRGEEDQLLEVAGAAAEVGLRPLGDGLVKEELDLAVESRVDPDGVGAGADQHGGFGIGGAAGGRGDLGARGDGGQEQ